MIETRNSSAAREAQCQKHESHFTAIGDSRMKVGDLLMSLNTWSIGSPITASSLQGFATCIRRPRVLCLREKLGPILWQLPPRFVYDPLKLEAFFRLLPRTTSAAAALARKHDSRLDGRAWTKADRIRPLRHALKVRHIFVHD